MRKLSLCLAVGLALLAGLMFWPPTPSPSPTDTSFSAETPRQAYPAALSAPSTVSGKSDAGAVTRSAESSRPAVPTTEALSAFRQWSTDYVNASPADRAAMTAEGVGLAEARRPALKQLIKEDPRRALDEAVPMVTRQQLPAEVVALLEERVSGRAALRVYQGVGLDNASPVPTVRVAEFAAGETYQAYTYGRRTESVRWLADASLNGIAVDREFAVHEDPIRQLEVGELPDPAKPAVAVCPVSGNTSVPDESTIGQAITEETPAIEAFGEIIYLCNGAHVVVYRETLIYAEGSTGGPSAFTGILPAVPTPSIGNVKVLVIPMTFADQNDTPSTESVLYQLMRDVGDHYAKASYGKLTLLTTVTPPIKLPHNEAWYIQKDTSNGGNIDGLGLEHSHARAEARKLGFDDDEFDCVVVRLRGGPRTAGGYGGGRSVWIYGDGVNVTAHEIGHAFGLAHANFWETAGTSAIGAGGNDEYGGHWDVMGGIGLPEGHYNVQGKNQIRWLPNDFVTEVTVSGLYRIYAQDQPILEASRRYALKIRKDNVRTYWGELRGVYTGSTNRTWADFGLILGWRFPNAGGSNWQLIDTTPGSAFGKDDSPISLGRTFADTEAGIYLTTVAVNPATAEEPKSVEVVVNLGDFPSNRPPTLALDASAVVVPLNAPVTFIAAASDPDGDALAYSWQHFGDSNYRTISPNSPVTTRAFTNAGKYVVTCTASDMKGGSTTRNLLITVGNGGGRSTISGRITLNGQGLANVTVNANGANGVITDSDGRYTIPNLANATYAMTPLLYGYSFTELFNNSVTVAPSFDGADFEAAAAPRVTLVATAPACNEATPATPAQFTLTRSGDASQPLTVNILAPSGTATRTTDYTLSPAPAPGSQGLSNLTFAADADTLVLSVTPVDDTAAEGPETLILELAPGNGYIIAGLARATVVVNDNDTLLPKVSLAVGEAKTVEGSASPAKVVFTRSGSTVAALNVPYSVSGTALSGLDFNALSGTQVIPIGASTATLNVLSVDDALSEQVETVSVRIASSATLLADPVANSATVSIVDDDIQVVTVRASDPIATERNLSLPGVVADTATFLVARTGDISQPLTVYYAMAGTPTGTIATALHGVDYEGLPGVLVIPAGQSNAAVTIVPRWDGLGEGQENVEIQLGAGPTNYRLGIPNTANANINDAGDPPYVEVLGADNAVEGGTVGRFRFSLKGSAAGSVTVNYTLSGTATSGGDYNALPGSVVIPGNGLNTVEITVTPVNDAAAEDLETIILTITPAAGYQVFPPTGSATIWMRDNEQPTLFVDAHVNNYPPTITENGSGASFYVSRTGSTAGSLTVNYTLSGTAVNGTDYVLRSGTTNIAAGALGVDIPITPINDALVEGTETVTLTLAAGAYGRGPAATMYLSDDEQPSVLVGFPTASATALESAGTVNVPVTLSAAAASEVTVEYLVDTGTRSSSTVNGTAAVLPYWVRCQRIGNNIIGSISPDGVAWTAVSTQAVALPSASYLAGLYVCSFNTSLLCTSVFDNVTITGLQPGGTQGARTGGNIGTTAVAGSATVVGSTYTVAGAGDNVEGTTDQGYFTWWPISNSTNCTITARVVSQQNTAAGATAGVMIRESTANNVRRGYMAATPGSGFEYHYRTAVAGQEAKSSVFAGPPIWVRLQRTGNTLRAYQSSDGTAWTPVGPNLDLAFGPEVLAGLAVSSQSEGTLAKATLDNVTLTPGPLPELLGRTIGLTAIQGADSEVGGFYTVEASGDGMNGTTDDCYFLSAPVSGDFTLSARVTSVQSTAATPQAGVMVRENTGRRARSAYFGGPPGAAPQLVWRNSTLTLATGVGVDYTLAPGVLTFPPGTTTQNIPISIVNDTIPERDEPVMIVLRNAYNARLGTLSQQFAFVIVDDDAPPPMPFLGFASATGSASEGSGVVQVPVVLSTAEHASVSVVCTITAGSATAGSDFIAASTNLIFLNGETVKTVSLPLLDDPNLEPSETVLLTLSNPFAALLGSLTNQTFTILDNDAPIVTISSTDTNATEIGDPAVVTVTRTGSTNAPLTVNLSRTGTATADLDYSNITATAIIPAGAASLTLTLNPAQDIAAEGMETAAIGLLSGAGYVVGTPFSVTNYIADDDLNVVNIVATGATAIEGGTNGTLTVTRSGVTTAGLTVNLIVTGTASSGADFTTSPATIASFVLAAGQSSRTIGIVPVNDPVTEGPETVLVQIAAGGYDIGEDGYASVILHDNDIPPTVFISSPGAQGVMVASSNGVEFAVTADDDGFPQPLTYSWTQVAGPGTVAFGATSGASTPATFSAPGTYLVRVSASDGQFSASDQITVNIGPTNALAPAEWLSTDVGPPTVRGFSGASGSNWVLAAGGVGFASNSDRAHAVTRQVTGNGSIVARLMSVTGPSAAEAGLSVRDSLHRYSRRGALVYTASTRILRFRPRLVQNTTDFAISVPNLNLPLWLRLDRNSAAGTVSAFYATNNAGVPGPWTQVGTNVNVTMDATADYSLTADSGSDTVLATAVFDNLELTPAPSGIAELAEDFGAGTQTGTYSYDAVNDIHTLAGQGGLDGSGMFWGREFSGDFILTVFMTNATSGASSARSGIIVRDSMDDGPMAFVGRIPTGAYESFVWRTNPKGGTSGLSGITSRTRWLRFIRRGNQITALHAPNNNGVPGVWVQLGQPQTVFLQPTVLCGLYCDNAGGGVGLNTATFTRFSVVPLNKAPVVNAGPAPVNTNSPVSLAGAVTDDGLPFDFVNEWAAASAPGPVTFANSNALNTTASFADSGPFTFRLWADDGLVRTFDDVSFTGTGSSPFAAWQDANFVGGSSNPIAAPSADPDADGLNNLGEYAHGTNPNVANASPILADLVTIGPDQFLRVTVPKNPAATDITITVEASPEVQPATWSPSGLVTETNTPTLLRVRDGVAADSAPQRFLRVRVNLN